MPQSNTPCSTPSTTCEELLHRLRRLPFDALLNLVCELLPQLGYEQVQPAGRIERKGRNRGGGVDITASYRWGSARRTLVVQLKQLDAPLKIYQRSIDELRGVCLRQGASEGMLITTSSFSPTIAGAASPPAPLYLMNGEELAFLLYQNRIGVTRAGRLDESLFQRLERASLGKKTLTPQGIVLSITLENRSTALHRVARLSKYPLEKPF